METQALSISNALSAPFSKFIRLLIWKFEPTTLFCFSKNTTFKASGGCFRSETASTDAHYCLLMVTEAEDTTIQTVQKFINSRFNAGKITILCYSKRAASIAVIAKNKFFLKVYSRAQLLYSKHQFVQTDYNVEPNRIKMLTRAEQKLSHGQALMNSFFAGAAHSFNQKEYPMCVLMLHQVTEQCLILLLNLHLSFQMELHSLSTLIGLCSSFSDRPLQLFLSTEEDKRLFEILSSCSSSAAYNNPNFSVAQNDAQQLFISVSTFLKWTKLTCADRIKQLEQQAVLTQTALA
jgi:HEPN domain-containing protein